MPAQSKSQQRFFGVVKAMQKGDIPKKGRAGKIAKSMSKDDVDDFASTKHKGKPEKVKREQRVRELIKKMVREELAEMNEVRIPFSSSHIKQLKRAFKDMKGTLPDNNPLVQQIVTLLKKTDKKVLKQIANADIKYLSDKAKDILGEGTCGYGENGELGEEPAGPHLIKKKLKEKQSAAVQRMAKQGMWVVYDTPGEQTIKVVKNERAAKMLVKKLKKSGKYNSPEAKAIKLEGKINEKMDRKKAAIILKQIGGNRFIAMTGAKGFAFSDKYMSFKIGRNSKGINFVRIGHNAKDLYDMEFGFVSTKGIKVKKKVKDVYADMLGQMFKNIPE